VEVLEHLLSEEISANQKIEAVITEEDQRKCRNLKVLVLGTQWGRNVFFHVLFAAGGLLRRGRGTRKVFASFEVAHRVSSVRVNETFG